jgi:putative (di)nucleoside polyphosphate hydrolase
VKRREDMPYRDCVGVALFNREGLAFIGRRMADPRLEDKTEIVAPWQMPQGGIDKGEDPLAAATRELFEETSVRSVRLVVEAPDWILYDLPDEALGVALSGKYRGQRQRWFAFAFEGEDAEIDVLHPAAGAHQPEFDAWRWEPLASLPDLIVPFKRDAYLQVVATFAGVPEMVRMSQGRVLPAAG